MHRQGRTQTWSKYRSLPKRVATHSHWGSPSFDKKHSWHNHKALPAPRLAWIRSTPTGWPPTPRLATQPEYEGLSGLQVGRLAIHVVGGRRLNFKELPVQKTKLSPACRPSLEPYTSEVAGRGQGEAKPKYQSIPCPKVHGDPCLQVVPGAVHEQGGAGRAARDAVPRPAGGGGAPRPRAHDLPGRGIPGGGAGVASHSWRVSWLR